MGQKTNLNIFKLGFKSNEWGLNTLDYNFSDISFLLFQNKELCMFIEKFFQNKNFLIAKCKVYRSSKFIKIVLSYYKLNYIKSTNLRSPRALSNAGNYFDDSLLTQFAASLLLYTKYKLNITVVLENLNNNIVFLKRSVAHAHIMVKLRKYRNRIFFYEFLDILFLIALKKKNSKLLANLLRIQFSSLKKHNLFLHFLKQSLLEYLKLNGSKLMGIKIAISGRINGKPRSSKKIIQIGTIPIQSINKNTEYNESVAYTIYGTFGIKIWSCFK